MPGAPVQRVTPESFQVWKQQKDELKEQVRSAQTRTLWS